MNGRETGGARPRSADAQAAPPPVVPPLPPALRVLRTVVLWVSATATRLAAGPVERLRAAMRDWAEHPARLVWTLLVSTALLSAVWPLVHYWHGFWLHGAQWGFLVNHQNDYGEGPLFNQEVILYHLLFGGRLAADGNTVPGPLNIYHLGERPPFSIGNYPPVFPLVSALFMRFVGLTFEAGRLVSTLSIIGASILVGLIVWQGTGQILPGILGFGILITMRNGIWSWGPYNRVDSLALFWSMLTIFLVLRYAGTRKVWWAVPVAILTVYTRQSMVDGIFAAFAYLLVRDWRRGLWVGAVTLAAGLATFVSLQIWTHGAFYLNVVLDNMNAYSFGGALGAWRNFIHGEGRFAFPLAVAGAAAGLLGTGNVLWPLWLAGSVFVFATIGKTGAASNYYFTLEAATSACAAVFVGRFRTFFRRAPFPLWPLELLVPGMIFFYVHGSPARWLPQRLPLVQQALQLASGPFLDRTPAAIMSHDKLCQCWHRSEDQGLVNYLSGVRGPVLAIDFPHAVVVQAGHEMQWQPFEFSVAYNDGTWNPAAFVDAVRDRYYALVITQKQLGGYIGGAAGGEISTALNSEYQYERTISGYHIYARNAPPTAPPPTVPQSVPRPLLDLPHHVLAGLAGLGQRLVARAAAAGDGSCHAGAARHASGFQMLCLAYNQQIFGVAGTAGPAPCFDQGGTCLDPQAGVWPNGGAAGEARVAGVPFWMPATGGGRRAVKSAVNFGPEQGGSATVRVPAGHYSELYFIAAAGNGPGTADITFRYAGGASDRLTQQIDDWCAVELHQTTAGRSAFLPGDRWDIHGNPTTPSCGVLEYQVPIPAAGRTLQSIVFTNDPSNHGSFEPNVMAVTLG